MFDTNERQQAQEVIEDLLRIARAYVELCVHLGRPHDATKLWIGDAEALLERWRKESR